MLNLQELSNLSESKLNELLLNYDKWQYNTSTNQVSKKYKDINLIFDLNDFSPFSKPKQADMILQSSYIDFSGIQQNNNKWGLMVFEDKNKKYLILESDSKMKSSLLLLLAIRSGLLQP